MRDRSRSPRSDSARPNSRAGCAPHAGAGFTLLELLVALTLFGLITAMLFGGLRFGIRVWESGDARSDEASELRVAQGFIGRRLAQAYPVVEDPGSTPRNVVFDGTQETLDFVSLMPAHLGIGGLYRIGLSLSDGSGPRRLVMTRRLLHPDLADDDAETTMLIDGVEDIEFAYFGALDEAGPSLWHDRWGESEHLPALVRMRVDFGADSRRSWPEMVVAPKIDTLAACVYDPITKKCRNL